MPLSDELYAMQRAQEASDELGGAPQRPLLGNAADVPPSAPRAPIAPTEPLVGVPHPELAGKGALPVTPGAQLAELPGGGARAAGFQPATRSETSKQAMQYGQDTLGAIGESLGARHELSSAQLEAEGARGGVQRQQEEILAFNERANAEKARIRNEQQLSAVRDYHRRVEGLMQSASSDKEDPNKWFHDMPTGNKILTALAMAVSGFGFGYTHGGSANPMEWVNGQIRASVDSQRQAHAQKLEQIGGIRTSFGELKEQFGDEEKARLASELAQRQVLIGTLQRQAADATAPAENRLRAAQYMASLKSDNEKTLKDLDHDQATSIERLGSETYKPATSGAGNIGVEVKLANGTRRVVPVALAKELGLLESPLTAREKEATIAHTEAETAKLAGEGGGGALSQLQATAAKLKSTALSPTRALQGTEARESLEAQKDYAAQFWAAYRSKHPGKLTEEQRSLIEEAYIPKEGDFKDTLQHKIARGLAVVGGAASVSAGEGAEQE